VTRWYPVEPADEDFLASAPHVFTYQKRFAAPPQTVWESLISDQSIAAWSSALKSVTWTSPRPFGVGTTREVAPPVGPRMRERYFLWEEGRRHSFAVYESTAQLFKRFAEDYLVEPDGDDTLFTWVLALEPQDKLTLPVKVLAPVIKAAFGKMPSDGQKYWARHSKRA
jgi:polyketide cyclase/dehydrase/lipid transport protein